MPFSLYLYPLETNLPGNNHDTPMVIPANWCLMREYARAGVYQAEELLQGSEGK